MLYSVYPVDILHINDNYVWIITPRDGRTAFAVDPGDAGPVLQWLAHHELDLGGILVTHRHWDHVNGIDGLLAQFPVPVWGPGDAAIAQVTHPVKDGDQIELAGLSFDVMAIPGHTREHIAYYCQSPSSPDGSPDNSSPPALFCGDTLFASGCGRVFDGKVEELYHSLSRLARLPQETQVYCAHEYTLANLRFASAVEPDNPAIEQRRQKTEELRQQGLPSLPVRLGDELACNPFLRTREPAVIASAGAQWQTDLEPGLEVFAALRRWKDQF